MRNFLECSLPNITMTKRHLYSIIGEDQNYPSVTTVLHESVDEGKSTGLQRWRDMVGEDVAKYILRVSAITGTEVHKMNECYLLGIGYEKTPSLLSEAHHKKFRPYLDKIDDIYGCEVKLVSHKMELGGTADVIASYDGVPSIIDFKTKRSVQKEFYISDYKLQATAYSLMFKELTGIIINQGVILMSTEKNTTHEFKFELNEFEKDWNERLDIYNAESRGNLI